MLALGTWGVASLAELWRQRLLSPSRDDEDRLELAMDAFRRPDKAGQDDEDSLV
jgi:hypothetical protein